MKSKRLIKFFSTLLAVCMLLSGCADAVNEIKDKVQSFADGKESSILPMPSRPVETAGEEKTPTEENAPTEEATQPTEAATEAQPVYETKTVYLCTLETLMNYEDDSTFHTAKTYDEYGRLYQSWQVKPDGSKGAVTTYEYDELGNNTARYNESGSHYEMTYDEAGRLLSQLWYSADVCKSEYHYTYDENGYLVEEVRISRYSEETLDRYKITYNEDHTLADIRHYTNGAETGYTEESYNAAGQVLISDNFDQEGAWRSSSVYEYDSLSRLSVEWWYSKSETQADYDIIYTYDENGLLISKNVDYYYGYLMTYTYEPFEILVPVE